MAEIPENDSALGIEDNARAFNSYTTSIRESIYENIHRYGRSYHKYREGQYPFPNDQRERARLDLQHEIIIRTLDRKLYAAPLNKDTVKRVLDVGTGTGVWAVEFGMASVLVDSLIGKLISGVAEEFPNTEVIGVDLSPIQSSFVPPNCLFEVDDLEQQWMFSHRFDYIHSRMMVGSFQDYPKFYKQAFENLTPGGYMECQDLAYPLEAHDDSCPPDKSISKWCQLMIKAGEKKGQSLTAAHKQKEYMEAAGFVDVYHKLYEWPVNSWPEDVKQKELGVWNLVNTADGLQAFSLALFTGVLGMTREEVEVLLAEAKKDMQDESIHGYWPFYVTYGKKPE